MRGRDRLMVECEILGILARVADTRARVEAYRLSYEVRARAEYYAYRAYDAESFAGTLLFRRGAQASSRSRFGV